MSLKSIEGTPTEQFRSDINHATSLDDSILQKVMQVAMKFVSSVQETDSLIKSLADLASEHGVNATLLKYSARGLVHISSNDKLEPTEKNQKWIFWAFHPCFLHLSA